MDTRTLSFVIISRLLHVLVHRLQHDLVRSSSSSRSARGVDVMYTYRFYLHWVTISFNALTRSMAYASRLKRHD